MFLIGRLLLLLLLLLLLQLLLLQQLAKMITVSHMAGHALLSHNLGASA
jgi:hypothetical protein